jgi:hypothetical protein
MTLPLVANLRRALPAGGARVAKRVVAQLFAWALVALVVTASLTSGRSFLWCAMMERAVEACCCDPVEDDHEASEDGRATLHAGCCEHQTLAEAAPARVSVDAPEPLATMPVALPSAPVPTVVAATRVEASARRAAPSWLRARPIRAGPETAREIAARLQVFRC